ncbi:MAG: phosphoenolpyruvate mutase [Candidatus Pelagibacter sp. TMED273]|nr:MAG: phosphoenolpyruvate mutase [Candidatus Pelagibacter sp. TMED273]|tara:strand:- start:689 stop:1978 length:1290 start_codon:yes stop_codon:yes gene_type:complete
MKKIVYVPLAVDILHSGHLNIINKAKKYGKVIIGLLSDNAVAEYKNIPSLEYEERYKIVKNLKNVHKIIKQDTWDYSKVLNSLKPNYFVHGDDWKKGIQKKTRQKVIKLLKKNKGKLIEIPYTKNISSSSIKSDLINHLTPTSRVSILKRLIDSKKIVRILESHSPLSGLIAENMKFQRGNVTEQFDGMWSSSLTDSSLKGKPDNQSLDFSSRFSGIGDLFDVTTKPLIFDADNGGRLEHLPFTVRTLERLGVSAIMIEDKIGLKKNSLFKDQSGAKQDSIKDFCKKIDLIKKTRNSTDFLIGARIESFILGKGLQDGLKRAKAYSEAGADLILIHSKEDTPKEIFSFSKIFRKTKHFKPLVSVPSTYSKTTESMLVKNGFKIVIYANQMLRASYPAMENVAKTILKNQRSFELEKKISSVKEVINLIK